jgi:hypothetical protein
MNYVKKINNQFFIFSIFLPFLVAPTMFLYGLKINFFDLMVPPISKYSLTHHGDDKWTCHGLGYFGIILAMSWPRIFWDTFGNIMA